MKHLNNRIFQMMRRHQDGMPFSDETVSNWYRARRFVLDSFNIWTGRIGPDSGRSFRIVLDGSSPLVYSVVRHIALMAHFPNFDEAEQKRFSTITILYPKEYTLARLEAEIDTLAKEEYLFNLIRHSFYTLVDADGNSKSAARWLPFLDIRFRLVATDGYEAEKDEVLVTEDDIRKAVGDKDITSLADADLTAAMFVNQAYCAGAEITNLSATENERASRYCLALDCLNASRRKDVRNQWLGFFRHTDSDDISRIHKNVNNILSSIFCADTFESRLHGLMDIPVGITYNFLVINAENIRKIIAGKLSALSKSEHARWNAEKLILGFRPLDAKESFADEMSIGRRDAYRKELKNSFPTPPHIDILSCADLRRINPEDQKYDNFIMLAIPTILMQKYRPGTLRRYLSLLGI